MSFRMFASITAIVCGLSLAALHKRHPPPGPTPRQSCGRTNPCAHAPCGAGSTGSKNINIRIDATVTESRGAQVIDKKVISLTCVDGYWRVVRSSQDVPFKPKGSDSFNYRNTPLNMDATWNCATTAGCWTRITRGIPESATIQDRRVDSTAVFVRVLQSS